MPSAERGDEAAQRVATHDRHRGAADHDDRRQQVDEAHRARAFEQNGANSIGEAADDADDGCDIQFARAPTLNKRGFFRAYQCAAGCG